MKLSKEMLKEAENGLYIQFVCPVCHEFHGIKGPFSDENFKECKSCESAHGDKAGDHKAPA